MKKNSSIIFVSAVIVVLLAVFIIFGNRMLVNADGFQIVSVDIEEVMSVHPAMDEAVQKFQEEIQELQKTLDEMDESERPMAQQMMQMQLQETSMALQEEAFGRIREDIRKVADSMGYKYVFDSSVLIVGGKDITGEVISALAPVLPDLPPVPDTGEPELPFIPLE